MSEKDTTVRLKSNVWELVHMEQQLGESKSDTIERVFKERFNVYDVIMDLLYKENKGKEELK